MAERDGPRMSVNKLGEYTVATPARRRSLVRDQKNPKKFKAVRYTRVRNVLREAYSAGTFNEQVVLSALDRLAHDQPTSDWDEQDLSLSLDALELYVDTVGRLDFGGLAARVGDPDPPKKLIGGVLVSVRPDLVLQGVLRGKSVVGAVKFHFAKTQELGEDASKNVGAALYDYVAEHLADGREVSRAHCLVVDLFAQDVTEAPSAMQRRREQLDAACQEIALWWREL